MFQYWTFSPTSYELVQKCINASEPLNENNKWVKAFKIKCPVNVENEKNIAADTTNEDEVISITNAEDNRTFESLEDVIETIENENLSRFDYMIKECLENKHLPVKLAQNLSTSTVEKILKYLLNNINTNESFLFSLFHDFMPTYLKREYTHFCTDFLVQATNLYPKHMEILLEILFQDTNIPNNIIQEYVSNLSEEERGKFIFHVMNIQLNADQFVQNVFTIYLAYKECKKTEMIQRYILSCLQTYGQACIMSKNYGRLLLTYLQAEKELGSVGNALTVSKLVEQHMSPFKRPCLNVMKNITK